MGSAPDADIVLRDTAISGKHASLRYKDQKFTITDLDSTNGTYLNDRADPIAREELKDNDVDPDGRSDVEIQEPLSARK